MHHRHAATCSSSGIRKSRILFAEFGKCSELFSDDSEAFLDDKLSIGLVGRRSEDDSLDDDVLDVHVDGVVLILRILGIVVVGLRC